MSSQWSFSPDYRVVLKQRDGKTWSLTSLQSCQAMLATTGGVGQFSAVFHDPTDYIKKTVQPHAMDLLQLWLKNRYGQWGKAWTGYVDTSHRAFDPDAGNTVQVTATSPYKLFEKTTQTPAQTARLAVALALNVTGSTVLLFACDAVGYPRHLVRVHPVADAGSGFGNLPDASVFTTPDAATWSTPLQALLNNTGLELFCDEAGRLYYRQMDFITPWAPGRAAIPRPVRDDDVLHADLFESDQTAVTRIEVRSLATPIHQSAPFWQAPAAMERHLRPRHIVVTRPDITQQAAAQYLANTLGQQYAAGVLQGTVTLTADPLFGIGTLCRVPSLADGRQDALGIRLDATSVYYISSVTYQLDWGSTWAMTLGLSFGRGHDQTFPYVGDVAFPLPSKAARVGFAHGATVPSFTVDAANAAQLTHPFSVVARPALGIDQVTADPTVLPEGTVIAVRTAHTNGATIGPTLNGEYNVVKAVDSGITGYTIGLRSTAAATGYVTLVTDGSSAPQVPGADSATYSGPTQKDGTGRYALVGPVVPFKGTLPTTGNPWAIKALAVAYSLIGAPYWPGTAGPKSWDCSGLVAWSYNQIGVPALMVGVSADVGPHREWDYFLTHGATRIDPAQAQGGDLLFIIEPNPPRSSYAATQCSQVTGQCGFSHIAFCITPGNNLGADNETIGTAVLPNAGFKSFFGTPFTDALNMSAFKP